MNTEYYDSLILMFHCILFIESIFCTIVFIKNIHLTKSPDNTNILFIMNISQICLALYCAFYVFLEYNFLIKYFDDVRLYFYELYSMSMQIIFMAIFVKNYLRKEK